MKFIKQSYSYQSIEEHVVFSVEIGVSKENGHFYFPISAIPQEVRDAVWTAVRDNFDSHSKDKLWVTEFSHVSRGINAVLKKFEEIVRDEGSEKVIVYQFHLNGDLTPDLSGNDKGSIRYHDLRVDFRDDRLGLVLEWAVWTKNRINGEIQYFERGSLERNLSGKKEIPHTPEREAWFEGLEESLRKLMLSVHAFMQLDSKKLEAFIDSGQKPGLLLLGGKK